MDGTLDMAKFRVLTGVALDGAGNIYVADSANYTIRKISPAGLVSTLAGQAGAQGTADGTGSVARFSQLAELATDKDGNVYVTDSGRVRRVTPDGVVTTLAGSNESGSADGPSASARFGSPNGLAVDAAFNIYVADGGNHTIRKISAGGIVSTLAGQTGVSGAIDGVGTAAQFVNGYKLALDGAGNVYVADKYAIRKITPAGVVSTLAGDPNQHGTVDGIGMAARFEWLDAIAVDGAGAVYVSHGKIIRKVTPSGVVSTLVDGTHLSGAVNSADLATPDNFSSLAVAADGSLLAANGAAVNRVSQSGTVTVYAGGKRAEVANKNGAAAGAHFNGIAGMVADPAGNYFIADAGNCTIRKITPALQVSILAGAAGDCRVVDGPGSAARFLYPSDLTSDAAGNLYISDSNAVRRISPDGVVVTLAGTPVVTISSAIPAKVDGTGGAASFANLKHMSSNAAGQLFVTDGTGHCVHREGMFTPTPVPTTLRTVSNAGAVSSLSYATAVSNVLTDGAPSVATLGCADALSHDSQDNLYFIDGLPDNLLALRKRAPDGTISSYPPVVLPVLLSGALGVRLAPDEHGNLYLSMASGIYRVTPQGVINRIVGSTAQTGDLLTAPAGLTENIWNSVRYLGNGRLLVATDQLVFLLTLP